MFCKSALVRRFGVTYVSVLGHIVFVRLMQQAQNVRVALRCDSVAFAKETAGLTARTFDYLCGYGAVVRFNGPGSTFPPHHDCSMQSGTGRPRRQETLSAITQW